MNEVRRCSSCGVELSSDAPQELCPRCLLAAGLESRASRPDRPGEATATSPHSRGIRGFVPLEPSELAPLFPQLEVLELIGHGGMGAVYKARQPKLDRLVAVKILPRETAGDPAFAERFAREARALARLSHPHIVPVYDFGEAGELFYFIMEYVDGVNLREMIRGQKLSPAEALAIVPQVCEALQYAHDEGFVHRDIKPENILIDKRGRVKIADFGLAKLLFPAADDYTLTRPQQVMGTPQYMAPEQIETPQQVDHRADIYSLGVVFYEMLTGELPLGRFETPSQRVEVDVRLDEVVLRALEKRPERRYQQASEVKTDVELVGTGSATTGHRQRETAAPEPARPAAFSEQIAGMHADTLIWRIMLASLVVGAGAGVGFVLRPLRRWGAMRPIETQAILLLLLLAALAVVLMVVWRRLHTRRSRQLLVLAVGAAYGLGALAIIATPRALAGITRPPTQPSGPSVIVFYVYVLLILFLAVCGIVALIVFTRWYWHRPVGNQPSPSVSPVGDVYALHVSRRHQRIAIAVAATIIGFAACCCGLPLLILFSSAPTGEPHVLHPFNEEPQSEEPKSQEPSTFTPPPLDLVEWRRWDWGPEGPEIDEAFARDQLNLTSQEIDRVNGVLQSAHRDYMSLESQHTSQDSDAEGHLITRIDRFSITGLEDRLWTELDQILTTEEQQRLARFNLHLHPPYKARIRPQNLTGSSLEPGIFGWSGDPVRIEIWRVGTWFHWIAKVGGNSLPEQQAQELPPTWRRFWREPERDEEPPAAVEPEPADDSQ